MRTPIRMALPSALLAGLLFAGCVTTAAVGSRNWHEQRIAEIDAARASGEISEEAYLSLKNEADETRVEYQEYIRSRLHYGSYYSYYPYYGHHFYPHYYHHRHRHH